MRTSVRECQSIMSGKIRQGSKTYNAVLVKLSICFPEKKNIQATVFW